MTKTPSPPRRRILIVDDVPDMLMVFQDAARRLRDVEFDIVVEANGRRAIERIWESPFDIVVSDCRMRETDGVSVLSAAKEANPSGLRVLMTGYSTVPTDLARVESMEADAYLHKPLPVTDILKLLRALLKGDPETLHERRQHARAIERIAAVANEPVRVV